MIIYNSFNNPKLIELIKLGGIGVIPTDTIYGIVCSAFDQDAVEKIYEIKGRDSDKPFIILISSLNDLERFRVVISSEQREFLKKNWPGSTSVILSTSEKEFNYLSRGNSSLTFRLPDNNKLKSLLQKTGPLVAPSANPQGMRPAEDIDDVFNYFIDRIDFVVDAGKLQGEPSTLVDLTGIKPNILRQGSGQARDI